jgi:PAS domain S-box-containing protein
LGWVLLVAASLGWELWQLRRRAEGLASLEARASYRKDVAYRRWATMHGGVYVPPTSQTPPNPYLDVPERDVTTTSGRALTLVNPAYMTRQVHEAEPRDYGTRGHITSLNPLRPENAADAWETNALRAFGRGVKEVTALETLGGKPFLRFMSPMLVERGCLRCHAKQGYQEGEVRGGVSVSVPMEPYLALVRADATGAGIVHVCLAGLGLVGVWWGRQRLWHYLAERLQVEQTLRDERGRLRNILEGTRAGTWEWNVRSGAVAFNERWAQMLGRSPDELKLMGIQARESLCHPDDRQALAKALEDHFKGELPHYELEYRLKHKEGRWIWVQDRGCVLSRGANGEPLMMFGATTDISARKAYEAEILRLSRLYLALSQINQLITRAKTKEELLSSLCEILVRFGELRLVWVGWLDPQTQAVRPLACYGDEGGYLRQIQVFAHTGPEGRGPTGTAIREGRSVICNEFDQDPAVEPWRDIGKLQGFGASAAFPIRDKGIACGALSVYATQPGFFRDNEVLLLEEAAADISFALDHLEQEALKQRALDLAQQNAEELDRYFKSALDLLCIVDIRGTFRRLNPAWEATLGYAVEELEGRWFLDFVHPEDREATLGAVSDLADGKPVTGFTNRYRHRDGTFRWIEWRAFPQGELTYAVARDMTDKHQALLDLQTSEERLKVTLESIGDGFFSCDREWRFLYVNQTAAQMLERPREQLQREGFWEVFSSVVGTELEQNYRRAAAGESQDFENFFPHWNRWFRMRCFPLAGGGIAVYFLDTTAQREAAAKLIESEARLRIAIEAANIGLWDWDLKSDVVTFSPEWKRQIGYAEHEIPDHFDEWQSRVHPDDLGPVMRKVRAYVEDPQGSHTVEFRFRHKNGSYRWIQTQATVLRGADSQPVRMLGCHIDVTERKDSELRLRHSHDLLHYIITHARSAIAVHDRDLKYVFVSERYLREYGIQERDVIGKHHYEVFPDLPQKWRDVHQRALQGEVSSAEEDSYPRADGTVEWTRWECRPWYEADESIGGFIIYTEVITDRVRAQEELRKLSRAVEQSPAIIIITDPSLSIEYVNPKFTQVTGYSLAEVRGQSPRLLEGNQTPAEEYSRLWETLKRGGQWQGELHSRKRNGETYWEFASFSPIVDGQGRPTHFLAVKEDITARKALEAQLRQAQKLESVGQLAGGVAHDFNNILAAIMMHLSLLQQKEKLDPDTRQSLEELQTEAARAASLTRQLLAFSRRSVLEIRRLDLNELIANLLKMLGRLIGEHITVIFERHEALPAVEADAGMIEQVLLNLAVNARDAMPKGGTLTIRLSALAADEHRILSEPQTRPGTFVCLSVSDSGCGMDEATRKHIFEPFFTTKEVGRGTGLGLATVHGIVAQHKGWIEVESELGRGSTFRVYFPAAPRSRENLAPRSRFEAVRGKETILLVEDESSLRRVVAQALGVLGYSVLQAVNGQEAMDVWQKHGHAIDLLFSDMVMPEGMTGLDLAQRLRKERPSLKVIISSGYNVEITQPGRLAAEGIFYLQKPFQVEVMAKAVRDCLEKA